MLTLHPAERTWSISQYSQTPDCSYSVNFSR